MPKVVTLIAKAAPAIIVTGNHLRRQAGHKRSSRLVVEPFPIARLHGQQAPHDPGYGPHLDRDNDGVGKAPHSRPKHPIQPNALSQGSVRLCLFIRHKEGGAAYRNRIVSAGASKSEFSAQRRGGAIQEASY